MKFYYDETTTFKTLLKQAAKATESDLADVVLKDAHGALWPPHRKLRDEIHDSEPIVRITE